MALFVALCYFNGGEQLNSSVAVLIPSPAAFPHSFTIHYLYDPLADVLLSLTSHS